MSSKGLQKKSLRGLLCALYARYLHSGLWCVVVCCVVLCCVVLCCVVLCCVVLCCVVCVSEIYRTHLSHVHIGQDADRYQLT